VALLDCRSVTKSFGGTSALKGVDLSIDRGEIVGIGGPNGAGKTTLLEIISGVDSADSGFVEFDGQSVVALRAHEIYRLGLARVFQSAAVFSTLSVFENVVAGVVFKKKQTLGFPLGFDHDSRTRALQAIELVGLKDKLDIPLERLPVLDRKLTTIASAIAGGPQLLLLDEPVGGLNPKEADSIATLLHVLRAQGMTLLVIEHVMRFMAAVVSRIVILHHGENIFAGSFEDVLSSAIVREIYLGSQSRRQLEKTARV
jgi:branched-chain amino acid transport system ATP-binding protein